MENENTINLLKKEKLENLKHLELNCPPIFINNNDESKIKQLETQIISLIENNTSAVNSLQELEKIIKADETKYNKSVEQFQLKILELESKNINITKENTDLK